MIHGVEYGIGYAGGVGFRDDPHRVHPRCTGGPARRPAGGLWRAGGLTEYTQPHLVFDAVLRAAALFQPLLDDDLATRADHRDELAALLPLLGLERFDRRAVNRALGGLTEKYGLTEK